MSLVLVAAAAGFEQTSSRFIGGIIPLASWLVQIVGQRVIQQWNFTLSRGERGLRIERGLLSRTSQTIPYDRVQGIAIKEPFVWRRLGWQRLEVDVAGYASQGSDSEGNNANSTLLPISDAPLANAIIAELLPGADPAIGDRTYASPRSRWFAPIGFRYRWVAANDTTFVASEGWIERTTSIVPHHKTQSVELQPGSAPAPARSRDGRGALAQGSGRRRRQEPPGRCRTRNDAGAARPRSGGTLMIVARDQR